MAALAVVATVAGIVLGRGVGGTTTGIGDTVTGEVGPGGRDQYTFDAAEGQRIFPLNGGNPATGTCEGLDDLSWSLRREDGQTPLFDQRMNDCSYPSGPEGYDLSAGTYILAIRNAGATATGYEVTLVNADPNEFEIEVGGPPVTGDIERGVANVYTFTVDEEQAVHVDNQELDHGCGAAYPLGWSLRRVGGAPVFENEPMLNCQDPCPREGCTLTRGSYALVVSGSSEPGRFRFTLRGAENR